MLLVKKLSSEQISVSVQNVVRKGAKNYHKVSYVISRFIDFMGSLILQNVIQNEEKET